MSQVSTTQVRYWPYRTRAVCPAVPIRPTQLSPTMASSGPSAEVIPPFVQLTSWGGNVPNQHHNLSLHARLPIATSEPQVHNHHRMRVQSAVGQAHVYQGTGGGRYRDQMPFNPHHGTYSVNNTTVYPLHRGGSRSFHPGHNTQMTYRPDVPHGSLADSHSAQNSQQRIPAWHSRTIQSLSACSHQSYWQAALPPQQSPPLNLDLSKMSGITTEPPPPASMIVEDTSPVDTPPARQEAGSKEASAATEACLFPNCGAMYGRPQELERHIREYHLPYFLYCEQEGCNWTGNRRYALQNHLTDKHLSIPMPEQEAFMIYDAKGLVKQLLTKDISVDQAVVEARSLYQNKAAELGKQGNRRWMRGLKVTASLALSTV